jgi:hypothetical protein
MKKYFSSFLLVNVTFILIIFTSCEKKESIEHPFTIGQSYGGGIIFYIDGTWQHGLICADKDQSEGIYWQFQPWFETKVNRTAIGTGQANTTDLVSILGQGDYAAKLCDDLVLNGYSDWFLPSIDESELMYTNLKLKGFGNFKELYYWSSSEVGIYNVYAMAFGYGSPFVLSKLDGCPVRAVRAF